MLNINPRTINSGWLETEEVPPLDFFPRGFHCNVGHCRLSQAEPFVNIKDILVFFSFLVICADYIEIVIPVLYECLINIPAISIICVADFCIISVCLREVSFAYLRSRRWTGSPPPRGPPTQHAALSPDVQSSPSPARLCHLRSGPLSITCRNEAWAWRVSLQLPHFQWGGQAPPASSNVTSNPS